LKSCKNCSRLSFVAASVPAYKSRPAIRNLEWRRNMVSLSDVSQVRAFLGYCQQMSQ
jgi:hypothetical protein